MTGIEIPAEVLAVLSVLETGGFEAHVVGGCVRDALMGRKPSDWDIATSALPEQVRMLFCDHTTIDVGIRHGTVAVVMGDTPVEVTTYRADGVYLDNRHPESVRFINSIDEDLRRRDFTMNAIAYNQRTGFTDPTGGRIDIASRIIRSVGDPDIRFSEDALRIMRAIRFASTLGFALDEQLVVSLHRNRALLENIAVERISAELMKLLVGTSVRDVLLGFADVLEVVIPEIGPTVGFEQCSKYHCFDVWEHTARAVALSKPDASVRLTLLMHDLGKPQTFFMGEDGYGHFYGHNKTGEKIALQRLSALRFSKAVVEQVAAAIHYHQIALTPENIQKWLSRLGEPLIRLLIEVKRGDMAAHSEHVVAPQLTKIAAYEKVLDTLIERQACFQRKDLAINGNDLLAIGIPTGKTIGDILDYLLESVIDGALTNTREELLSAAEEYPPMS